MGDCGTLRQRERSWRVECRAVSITPASAKTIPRRYSALPKFEKRLLDPVPGPGLLAATVPGAPRARLTLLRDHGTQPRDAVLRYAPSTP